MSTNNLILRAALVAAILQTRHAPPIIGCMRMVGINEGDMDSKFMQNQVQRKKKVLLDKKVPVLLSHRTYVNMKPTKYDNLPSMLFAEALLIYALCNVRVRKTLCKSSYNAFHAMHLVGVPYELANDETLQNIIQDLANVTFLKETLRAAVCILDGNPSAEELMNDNEDEPDSSHSKANDEVSLLRALVLTASCQRYSEWEPSPVSESTPFCW